MSTPANNVEMSSKHEKYSDKNCGSNSNTVECQSLKKPRTTNSRMAQQGNSSNVHQPICLRFQRWGNCGFGEKCRYVHITGGFTYGPSQGIGFKQGNLGKVVACRYFASGRGCPYGNECQFLHEGGRAEYRERSAITIARNRTHSITLEPKGSVNLRRKLKTRLCNQWERTGTCYYGSTCQFAHGKAELQSVGSSNPKSSAGVSAPVKNVASNKIGSSAPSENRFPLKWDNVHRISQVYGDWIESPQLSP